MADDADRAQQVVEQHIRRAFDRRRMYAAARWDSQLPRPKGRGL